MILLSIIRKEEYHQRFSKTAPLLNSVKKMSREVHICTNAGI